jgi:adenine-specific DNA methylase
VNSSPCPRLIELALPIREISAESVRDKSLRHSHISTLHLWWARRPLVASRAVMFGSLTLHPDVSNCPNEFRQAVLRLPDACTKKFSISSRRTIGLATRSECKYEEATEGDTCLNRN